MLKTAMLVSALAISAPAFAQDVPAGRTPQTTPPAEQATPADSAGTTPAPVTTPDVATAAQTTPAPTTQADPAVAPVQQAQTATPAAPAGAVTGASQIAQVIATEFPTYDKNADGNLDKVEFGSWMVALKTASDPATKAEDPATQKWVSGALASADSDKSGAVSKDELTKYLSAGAE